MLGLRRSGGYVRHGRGAGVPRPLAQPRAPLHARLSRERRHLLPAPRGVQFLLRRASRHRRGLYAPDQRQARHQLRAVQLLRRARRRPRDRGYGLVLRRGRGGHRLPQRSRREGGPCEGALVPSVRDEQVRGGPSRDGEEDRRARPHEGAGQRGRAFVHGRPERACHRGPLGHHRCRRPLRLGQQGHPARVRVRRVLRACEGRAPTPVHHRHRRRRDQPFVA